MDDRLALDDDDRFTGRLQLMVDAARVMGARFERDAATWEPHDWRDFD